MFRKNRIKNLVVLCLCFILTCGLVSPPEGTMAYVSYKSETCVNTFTGEETTGETSPADEKEPDDIIRNTSTVSPPTGSSSVKLAAVTAGGALAAVLFLTVKKFNESISKL